MYMEEKLLSMLGIARRAGKIAMGFDAAAEAMHKGEARLLVLAADLETSHISSDIRLQRIRQARPVTGWFR